MNDGDDRKSNMEEIRDIGTQPMLTRKFNGEAGRYKLEEESGVGVFGCFLLSTFCCQLHLTEH